MANEIIDIKNAIEEVNNVKNDDMNIIIKFYKESSSGTIERDFNMSEKYGNTENAKDIGMVLAHYNGIVRITSDNAKNDLILEYDSNKRKVNAVGNNFQFQATKLLDSIYLEESISGSARGDVDEILARQLVQLSNVYNGTLPKLSKETYLNQVKNVERGIATRETRNKYIEFLDDIIKDPKTTTLNKKWAMQIHNKISNEYDLSIAYNEALNQNLVDGTKTPFEYTSMVIELLTEAKSNNMNIDLIDVCKRNNIDISTGMVNERASFVAVSDEFQKIMIETVKKEQENDILLTYKTKQLELE